MEAQNRSYVLFTQLPAKALRALPWKTASHFSWNCSAELYSRIAAFGRLPGFSRFAGAAVGIAKILFWIFIVICVVLFIAGLAGRR